MENFYEEIVKNLKLEANKLSNKITKLNDKHDMNLYIACIKSLKETLDLISRYDWKLIYSEYTVKGDSDNDVKQVSVWEQNHDNQIRNHKIWNVVKGLDIATKTTRETERIIDGALKNIDTTSKEKVPMYIDLIRDNDTSGKVIIYYDGSITILNNNQYSYKDYATKINSLINPISKEKIVIYIDTRGYGMGLYDELMQYKDLNIKQLSINHNIFN